MSEAAALGGLDVPGVDVSGLGVAELDGVDDGGVEDDVRDAEVLVESLVSLPPSAASSPVHAAAASAAASSGTYLTRREIRRNMGADSTRLAGLAKPATCGFLATGSQGRVGNIAAGQGVVRPHSREFWRGEGYVQLRSPLRSKLLNKFVATVPSALGRQPWTRHPHPHADSSPS
jgi:hypothetical protein